MKHYIGKIEERNGDMEYDSRFLFMTRGNPLKYADKVAMEWRGSTRADWDEEHYAYWSDNTLIGVSDTREISKEDFEVLKKYIAVL